MSQIRTLLYFSSLAAINYSYAKAFRYVAPHLPFSQARIGVMAVSTLSGLGAAWRKDSLSEREKTIFSLLVPFLLVSALSWKEGTGWKVYGISLLFFPVAQAVASRLLPNAGPGMEDESYQVPPINPGRIRDDGKVNRLQLLSMQSLPNAFAPFFFKAEKEGSAAIYLLGVSHNHLDKEYPQETIRLVSSCDALLCDHFSFIESPKQLKGLHLRAIFDAAEKNGLEWFIDGMRRLHYKDGRIVGKQTKIKEFIASFKQVGKDWLWERNFEGEKLDKVKSICSFYSREQETDWGWKERAHPLLLEGILEIEKRYRACKSERLERQVYDLFSYQKKQVVKLDEPEALLDATIHRFLSCDLGGFNGKTLETVAIRNIEEYLEELEGVPEDDYCKFRTKEDVARFLAEEGDREDWDGLDRRNVAWRPKIQKALEQNKSTAIVVGYEHLSGNTGIYNFLQSQGYTLTWVGTLPKE